MSAKREQFEQFIEREYPALRRLAYSLTADWSSADDLALDSFVRVFRTWHRISHDEDPAMAVRRELASRYLSPFNALRRRSPPRRLHVARALHRIEGRSAWAIAQILECPEHTAASLLARAKPNAAPIDLDGEPAAEGAADRFRWRRARSSQLRALALSLALVVAGASAAAAKTSVPPRAQVLLHAQRVPSYWRTELVALVGYTIRHPATWLPELTGENFYLKPASPRGHEDPRRDAALHLSLVQWPYVVRQTPIRSSVNGWRYSTDRQGSSYVFDLGSEQSLAVTFEGKPSVLRQYRPSALRILSTLRRVEGSRTFVNPPYRIVIPQGWTGRQYPFGNGRLQVQTGRISLGPAEIGAGRVDPNGPVPIGWFQLEFHFVECDCGESVSRADFGDGTTTGGKPFRREERSLRKAFAIHFTIDWYRVTQSGRCRLSCVPPGAFTTLEATIIGSTSVFDQYVGAAEAIVASIRDADAVDVPAAVSPNLPGLFLP